MSDIYGLATKALHLIDAETAHGLTIQALKLGLGPVDRNGDAPSLAVEIAGLKLSNPIGLAAGFDKNAEVPDALLRLGFGFVEIGSVTPKPQSGNPRPRLFRLERDEAVVNRMGFNNDGSEAVLRRLASRAHLPGIVGVNVGANKDSPDRIADYVSLIETFAPVASYFTVNVSSPNTPGLRNLQSRAALEDLTGRVAEARAALSSSAERMRAPPPPADGPAFWTPPPRPRDLPTGEIIQWTGFSGPETTGHLTP